MMSFAALADPTRFHIVEMLAVNGRMAVGDIRKAFAVSAPAISQHLKVLKEARLVNVEVKAQQRIYQLNPAGIAEIGDWTEKMRKSWEKRLDRLESLIEAENLQSANPKKDT
jgi:DNA-binding transcriptional ArsR family regulator